MSLPRRQVRCRFGRELQEYRSGVPQLENSLAPGQYDPTGPGVAFVGSSGAQNLYPIRRPSTRGLVMASAGTNWVEDVNTLAITFVTFSA
jgi:hypothetical protein